MRPGVLRGASILCHPCAVPGARRYAGRLQGTASSGDVMGWPWWHMGDGQRLAPECWNCSCWCWCLRSPPRDVQDQVLCTLQ